FAGLADWLTHFFREFGQFALERLFNQDVDLGCTLVGHSLDLGINLCGLLAIGVGEERNEPTLRRAPVFPIVGRLKDCSQPIVVALRNRIVTMAVALGTTDRQSEERSTDDLNRFGHYLVAGDILIAGRIARAVRAHPQKAGRDEPLDIWRLEIV